MRKTGDIPSRAGGIRLHRWIFLPVIAVLGTVVLNDFVWDDELMFKYNPWLGDPSVWPDLLLRHYWHFSAILDESDLYWRPLLSSLFWFWGFLFGANAAAFHALSLLLHIISTLCLWLLLRELAEEEDNKPLASYVAAVFALHPLAMDTVSFATSMCDHIVAACAFGCVLIMHRHRTEKASTLALAGASALVLVACMSKESGVFLAAVPVVAFLLPPRTGFSPQKELARFAAAVMPVAVYLAARYGVLSTAVTRLPLPGPGQLIEAASMIFPAMLRMVIPWSGGHYIHVPLLQTWSAVAGTVTIVMCGALITLLARGKMRTRTASGALVFTLLFMLPAFLNTARENGVLFWPVRYMYVSLGGISIALFALFQSGAAPRGVRPRRIFPVMILFLAVLSFVRLAEFRTELDFWKAEISQGVARPEARIRLGYAYIHDSEWKKAREQFRLLLDAGNGEIARASRAHAMSGLCAVQVNMKKPSEAIKTCTDAYKLDSQRADALGYLARALAMTGNIKKADEIITLALREKVSPVYRTFLEETRLLVKSELKNMDKKERPE